MRVPFLRLLLVGGGAVVLATAGFAYMASNTIAQSSAGEGSASVSGYAATDITYNPDYSGGQLCQTWSGTYTCYVGEVQFTLTSKAMSAPANGAPTDVVVTLLGSGGTVLQTEGLVSAFDASNNWEGCTLTGWTANGSSANSGTVLCRLPQTPVSQVVRVDVEANQ